MIIKLNKVWICLLVVCVIAALIGVQCTIATHAFSVNKGIQTGKALPIIMYHQVQKDASRAGDYVVTPQTFQQDLDYILLQGYTPVTVTEVIDYVYNQKSLPEKPIILSFDDGYESFYSYVYPILKERNVKAVLSIIGVNTEQYSQMDDHNVSYSHVTFDEICEMHASGLVEIQNHSYNMHKQSGRLGAQRLEGETDEEYRQALTQDIVKLQTLLQEHCNITPNTYAYPFGRIGKGAKDIIASLGFKACLSCEEGINYIGGDPETLMHLKRYNRASGKSSEEFLGAIFSKITG